MCTLYYFVRETFGVVERNPFEQFGRVWAVRRVIEHGRYSVTLQEITDADIIDETGAT